MTNRPLESDLAEPLPQRIQQYSATKASLIDFVLEAEGDIAVALEAFSAQQLSRWTKPTLSGLNRTDLAIDMFLSEGQVARQSVIELFIQANPTLSAAVKTWIRQWTGSFNGLFVVRSLGEEGYRLTNWLTEKDYSVYANANQVAETLARITPGEIVMARLLPITATEWTFSGPLTLLGKLGKPKLAVAIGNFKQWFPQHLYGDAPELKEAAWESVKQHYEEFVSFFGANQVTLSGYELNQKLQHYQEQVTEKQLADAGLDSSKSLKDLAQEAGLSAEEITDAMDAIGEENKTAQQLMESGQSLKMVMPKVTLPNELRRAEAVTVLVHPRWGQVFLNDYHQLETLLEQTSERSADEASTSTSTEEAIATLDRLVLKYLENEQVTPYVWQRLAQSHNTPLTTSLRRILHNPAFNVEQDLDSVLVRYGKPLIPQLPETASVPVHLHNLFQAALQTVGKGHGAKGSAKKKSKKQKSKKTKSGFGT